MITLKSFGVVELHDSENRPLQAILAQPKRLALVVYPAVATPQGKQRGLAYTRITKDQQGAPSAVAGSSHQRSDLTLLGVAAEQARGVHPATLAAG